MGSQLSFIVCKTFQELHSRTALQHSPKQLIKTWKLKCKETQHKMAPYSSSNVLHLSGSRERSQIYLKRLYYNTLVLCVLKQIFLILWAIAATLFCFKAPEMFCALRSFPLSFHRHGGDEITTRFFIFWVNLSFKMFSYFISYWLTFIFLSPNCSIY